MAENLTQDRNEFLESMKLNSADCYGMDCALNAVDFAEKLMYYVMIKLDYDYIPKHSVIHLPENFIKSRFTNIVGDCVLKLIVENRTHILNCYKTFLAMGINDKDKYRIHAIDTSAHYLANGYHNGKFLCYAALLAGLSILFFVNGNTEILEASIQVLAFQLNSFIFDVQFSPKIDWFEMCLTAHELKKQMVLGNVVFHIPALKF